MNSPIFSGFAVVARTAIEGLIRARRVHRRLFQVDRYDRAIVTRGYTNGATVIVEAVAVAAGISEAEQQRAYVKRLRKLYAVQCPQCVEKRPKMEASMLLPQQKCNADGYVDPRPHLTIEEKKLARAAYQEGHRFASTTENNNHPQ